MSVRKISEKWIRHVEHVAWFNVFNWKHFQILSGTKLIVHTMHYVNWIYNMTDHGALSAYIWFLLWCTVWRWFSWSFAKRDRKETSKVSKRKRALDMLKLSSFLLLWSMFTKGLLGSFYCTASFFHFCKMCWELKNMWMCVHWSYYLVTNHISDG
jgi:hypothetical protein